MAQYFYDQLHCLARPGERVEPALLTTGDYGFVAGGRGLLAANYRGSIFRHVALIPGSNIADADVMIKFRQLAEPVDNYAATGIGIVLRFAIGAYLFHSTTGRSADTSMRGLVKVTPATTYLQTTTTHAAKGLDAWRWWRCKLVGTTFRSAATLVESPPLGAGATVDLSGAPASGQIGVVLWDHNPSSPLYEIAWLSFGTDGDAPPTGPTGCANVSSLSGTVTDHEGNPCGREVRVFLRSTGALVGYTTSDAVTGAWSVPTQFAGLAHDVVVQDDAAAPTLRDLVASNIVP